MAAPAQPRRQKGYSSHKVVRRRIAEIVRWRVRVRARTDRAFGAGHRSRKVELGPRPPDPLSDGLGAAVIND